MKTISNVLIKDLGSGIKKVTINDPKTYNSLSFNTLNSLLKTFKKDLLFKECIIPYLASIALNNCLPLRAGDVIRAFFFPKKMFFSEKQKNTFSLTRKPFKKKVHKTGEKNICHPKLLYKTFTRFATFCYLALMTLRKRVCCFVFLLFLKAILPCTEVAKNVHKQG